MDKCDKAFIDLVGSGYIEFNGNDFGAFHSGCVYTNIDYRINDQRKSELSFYGDDERQEVYCRDWTKIDDKGLYGYIFFHKGEECNFKEEGKSQRNLKIYPLNAKMNTPAPERQTCLSNKLCIKLDLLIRNLYYPHLCIQSDKGFQK